MEPYLAEDALPTRHVPDHTVNAAQREFLSADADPAWALKPKERVCTTCWLVMPCDCGAY